MKKSIIGILPLVDESKNSYWMLPGYMKGIENAGGLPVMLPLTENETDIEQMVDTFDGFLFSGGQDVSPELYGETASKQCGIPSKERDSMEKILLEKALKKNKAILGICRGIQFINAALGGTLYQDLQTEKSSELEHHQTPPYDKPVHNVNIVTNTPLYDLIKVQSLAVNSYHHQAVKDLSSNLLPMAYATDGLVEAVYMPNQKFVWALQWHPEFSYKTDKVSQAILHRFVECAGK